MVMGVNDLFASYGKTPKQQIDAFAGRHSRSVEFGVGCVQLDRKISSNQAHQAVEVGLTSSVIVRGQKPNTYRINR